MVQLEAKVVEVSTELADKDYEIEFYHNQVEELQAEIVKGTKIVETATASKAGAAPGDAAAIAAELESWK